MRKIFIFIIFIWGTGVTVPADAPSLVVFGAPWSSPYCVDRAYPHHLVNDNDEHLFILNKTAWAFWGCQYPEAVLQRAKTQGVNVLRVALEGTPYHDILGIDMWPWGGSRDHPDWSTINGAYWDEIERRIRMAGRQGIGFDLCIYFDLKPQIDVIEQHRFYWQTILERLGQYANILCWEIQNEHIHNEAFQDAAAAFFQENDPCNRPVITSDGTTDDAVWPSKPWMDMSVNHTCTGSDGRYPLDAWYLAVARNSRAYGKPAFCNESGREKRHKNDDGVHRRKQGWLWTHAGCYWTWHSWDGCEGIDSVDYVAPGGESVKPMADYFQSLPFWRLNPNFTVLEVHPTGVISAVLTDESRNLTTVYLCVEQSGETISSSGGHCRLPDGNYRIEFIHPVTLELLASQTFESRGLHQQISIAFPAFTDDVLIKILKIQEQDRSALPGTD